MGLPAAICKQIEELGLPVVATLHDYWFLCPNAQLLTNYDQSVCPGPRLWLNCARCAAARLGQPALNMIAPITAAVMAYRARILRKAMEAIDIFIAPTAFVQDLFVEKGMIPADRVIHVPHGVGTEMVRPRLPGPADGPLRVAYLGGISWQKGVHVLVDAMSLLEPSLVTLRIYGDMTAFPRYAQRLTDQAASQPNTSFAGRLTRAEVWEALAVTDVLVVPSLWYETAALVIQEAFAAGAPVIASRLGALQERVRHGMDGLLLPAGDSRALANALARLAADRNYFLGLQANIQPVVTISQHVKRVLSLYERLVIAAGQRYNSARERSIASTGSPH
jgi:glycosyltransferase involved in cell wall biosynthesis